MDFKNFMFKTNQLFPATNIPITAADNMFRASNAFAQNQGRLPPLEKQVILPLALTHTSGFAGLTKNPLNLEKAFLRVNGFSEIEMERTKKLVGRIAGKQNIDIRYKPQMNATQGGFHKRARATNSSGNSFAPHPIPDEDK